jgi:Na+-driven multidrug efflux pump
VVNHGFDVFLHSVCENFIEYFSLGFISEIGLKFSAFVVSLCGLGIRVTGFIE